MNNPVQWFEISVKDIERAKNFYEEVFKLEFQYIEAPGAKMYMFGAPDKIGSSGCLVQSSDNIPSTEGTILYFKSDDISEELTSIKKVGCTIVVPKTDIGEFGFYAQFLDTEGNRIGLHSDK
ncbi:VOC family protein [uncultured Maribacter sp.]|uniref:VOC family protein n=1 Tax=uncultured Maribacter sp. TaxID=431308 RepID=UPI002613B8B7|nr:VOC family protein [uncultured Maribacter sp.]